MIDEILNELERINLDWYYAKREAFSNEQIYDKELDRIYHSFTMDDSFTDDNGKLYPKQTDYIIDIDFVNYCWSSDFLYSNEYYLSKYEIEDSEINPPFSLKEISYKIELIIKKYFNVAGTPSNIAASISVISEGVKEVLLKKRRAASVKKPDKRKVSIKEAEKVKDEYSDVLSYFYFTLMNRLNESYKEYVVLSTIEHQYDEKNRLVFDLTQDELGALLYILNTAGFIKVIVPGDTDFVNFCTDRFYYSKGVEKVPTKASGLRKKYNDAKSDPRILAMVIDKFKTAFKDL